MNSVKVASPLTYVYVVKTKNKTRIYMKEGTARAQITRAVDQTKDVFIQDIELWRVGDAGWELQFSAVSGEHYSKISWKTVIEANKRSAIEHEVYLKKLAEARDRKIYEALKQRFE